MVPERKRAQVGTAAKSVAREKSLKICKRVGPSQTVIFKRLKELVNAKETKFFTHQGEIISLRDVEDNAISLRAVTLAMQFHDIMPDKRHVHTGEDGGPIQHRVAGDMNLKALEESIAKDKKPK